MSVEHHLDGYRVSCNVSVAPKCLGVFFASVANGKAIDGWLIYGKGKGKGSFDICPECREYCAPDWMRALRERYRISGFSKEADGKEKEGQSQGQGQSQG